MKHLKLLLASTLVVGTLANTACTHDEESVQDPMAAEKNQKNKHEFTVDKDGNINFKAEIVYFEFDDYTLTSEGMERLNALADHMKKHQKQRLNIEGHCDDRGSTEYNLALGQLRAQSVKRYLATQGITDKRLAAVSFGEEKPAITGHSEQAWAKNRRAEFKFVSND